MRPPEACPGLRNCLRHRYAWPQNPVLAWVTLGVLPKGGQDWTGYPPTPLRFTPTAPGPRGGEGRRAPTYKPQRFREQKASGTLGWPQLPGYAWVCLFVRS